MPSAFYSWENENGTHLQLKQNDESAVLQLQIVEEGTLMGLYNLDRAQATQLAQALVILQEFI